MVVTCDIKSKSLEMPDLENHVIAGRSQHSVFGVELHS